MYIYIHHDHEQRKPLQERLDSKKESTFPSFYSLSLSIFSGQLRFFFPEKKRNKKGAHQEESSAKNKTPCLAGFLRGAVLISTSDQAALGLLRASGYPTLTNSTTSRVSMTNMWLARERLNRRIFGLCIGLIN